MFRVLMAVALLLSVLLLRGAAAVHGHEHEHGAHGAAHSSDGHHGDSHSHGSEMAVPATLAEAWTALMAERDAIAAKVGSNSLGDVHDAAARLPGLAAAVLGQSAALEAGKRARVEGAVKQVSRVAGSLHDAAGRGDADKTRQGLARLDGLLALMRAQYPAGALDASAHDHAASGQASEGHAHGAHAQMQRPAGVVDVAPRVTVRIRVIDPFRFEPKRVEVQAGVPTRIEIENVGVVEHSFVVKTPDGERDWVHLHVAPGSTEAATYQLDTAGTYRVVCTIPGHSESGMTGELLVQAGHDDSHSHH